MVESQPPSNPAPGLSPFRGTFVGRQREMAELMVALDDALGGRGRLVMLAEQRGALHHAGLSLAIAGGVTLTENRIRNLDNAPACRVWMEDMAA